MLAGNNSISKNRASELAFAIIFVIAGIDSVDDIAALMIFLGFSEDTTLRGRVIALAKYQ